MSKNFEIKDEGFLNESPEIDEQKIGKEEEVITESFGNDFSDSFVFLQ